jgi:hypothetical protein
MGLGSHRIKANFYPSSVPSCEVFPSSQLHKSVLQMEAPLGLYDVRPSAGTELKDIRLEYVGPKRALRG